MNIVTVGDLIDQGAGQLVTGPFGTQLAAHEYVDAGTPVINVRNVGFGDVRASDLEFLDEETARRLARHRLRAGDIVFGRKGAVERHAFISPEQDGWIQGSDCIRLRLDADVIDPRFVSFALRTEWHKRWIQNHCSSGATMASLNQDILRLLEIPCPSLGEQRLVAEVLGAFDDLIDNNRQRIEILEELSRLVYREWFMNFRFPGHEDGELVESDLGAIPEGWEVRPLSAVLELAYGKALRSEDRRGGDVAVYGSGGLVGWHDKALVDGPGVVVGRKGNVGALYWSDGDFYPIDTTYFVKTELPLSFVYQQLRTLDFIDSHAAVPGLSRQQAYGLKVILPHDEVLERFGEVVTPMYELRRNLLSQITLLGRARDLLLPRLIAGELDVSDLDRQFEPVA